MKQSLKKAIKSLTILCLVFSCIVIASTAPSYAAGKTLKDYRDVITAVAKRYDNTYIIQGTDLANVKEMKLRRNSSDGIHPKKKFARNVVAKRFNRKFRATVLAPPKPEPEAESAPAATESAATEPAPAATN